MCKSCKLCKYLVAIIFTAAIFFCAGWLTTIHTLSISANESEVYATDMFGLEWIYDNTGATT